MRMFGCLCIVLSILVCLIPSRSHDPVLASRAYIERQVRVPLPETAVVAAGDLVRCPNGDGVYAAHVTLPAEEIAGFAESLEMCEAWSTGVLPDFVANTIYGGAFDGGYRSGVAETYGIPEHENGYWLFIDRHREQDKPFSERHSYNYTFGLFDEENGVLHVYKYDT